MNRNFGTNPLKLILSSIVISVFLVGLWPYAQAPAAAQEPVSVVRIPELPDQRFDYTPDRLPSLFRQRAVANADNMPRDNRTSDAGATLGRVLFYDQALSATDTVACASCHTQETGFATDARFGVGFQGGHTGRKPMGLSNARFYNSGRFFWDERAATLEDQVLMPIQDDIEMGMDLDTLTAKLQALDYYPPLFEDAFGSETVTKEGISHALAQFVRSLLSYESRYDEGLADNFAEFSEQESEGMQLFTGQARCGRCHTGQIQIVRLPQNNGLDRVSRDLGVRGVTGDLADDGEFKVPSLRNIALRAPYMHDGRLATLRDVVDFYDDDIQDHRNLDPVLEGRNGGPVRLNLTSREKLALVAFLETLTDEKFVTDPKFSDPFVEVIPTAIPSPTDVPEPTPTAMSTRAVPSQTATSVRVTETAVAPATDTAVAPAPSATPEAAADSSVLYLPMGSR
jgi:cytochrome c peroxidase